MSIGASFSLLLRPWVVVGAALMISACGGGGGGDAGNPATTSTPLATVDIVGLAATGAPIADGIVTAINARGDKATARSDASGRFTLTIAAAAPYLLQVSDASGKAWYSYAPGAGRANINPLTTLALLQANAQQPLHDLASGWATLRLSPDQVLEAAKVLNANLASLLHSQGVAATSTNVFVAEFDADGTGLDAVLDTMRVRIDCAANRCTADISTATGHTLVTWNAAIGTDGISLSWNRVSSNGDATGGGIGIGLDSCRAPVAGTYSLLVTTQVSGFGAVPVPDLCIDGLTGKPQNQSEFCGSDTVRQVLLPGLLVLSCRFDGSTGTIGARIGVPTLFEYLVTFSFIER